MPLLADRLIEICKVATKDVFIGSPFIKLGALKKVLAVIAPEVPLVVVVRFAPMDIASRVTDAGIVDLLLARPGTSILAQPSLHAKLYRADDRVLMGSANLTSRGLGWCFGANVELLIEVPPNNEDIVAVEMLLKQTAYPLTPEIVQTVLASLPSRSAMDDLFEIDDVSWLPACRRPEFLWQIYTGGDAPVLPAVWKAGKRDLTLLEIPPHLPRSIFEKVLKSAFISSQFYRELAAQIVKNGLSDSSAEEWLVQKFSKDMIETPRDTWAVAKEWLRQFNPGHFHFGPHEEKIIVAKPL